MTAGVCALRAEFPLFAAMDAPFHYLDSAATAQLHRSALEAVIRHETTARANVQRGSYGLAEAATRAYEAARAATARCLNAQGPDEIVFTAGATAALNLVAHAFGATLRPGDEVVLSLAEHHSNFVPWLRLRERVGITLRFLPVDAEGRIDAGALAGAVSARCRLIAVTHASNVTGAVTDVGAVVAAARAVGAQVLLDGAQQAQHGLVDVQALGVDYYVVAGHKCFGPNGIGVLWGRAEALAALPPFLSGGGMVGRVTSAQARYVEGPRRFEAGTPPIAQAVGLGAALDWMSSLDWGTIRMREARLSARLLSGLAAMRGVQVFGPIATEYRLPVVSFSVSGLHPHDVCQVLGGRGVAVRGGHQCAQPLMEALGLDAVVRASLALYNDEADVDALLAGLEAAIQVFA